MTLIRQCFTRIHFKNIKLLLTVLTNGRQIGSNKMLHQQKRNSCLTLWLKLKSFYWKNPFLQKELYLNAFGTWKSYRFLFFIYLNNFLYQSHVNFLLIGFQETWSLFVRYSKIWKPETTPEDIMELEKIRPSHPTHSFIDFQCTYICLHNEFMFQLALWVAILYFQCRKKRLKFLNLC